MFFGGISENSGVEAHPENTKEGKMIKAYQTRVKRANGKFKRLFEKYQSRFEIEGLFPIASPFVIRPGRIPCMGGLR